MPVNYLPFESKTGFKSPGFNVDSSGTLDVQVINVPTINAETVILNGFPLGGESSTDLNITGNFSVSEGSTPYLEIINGEITISNRLDSVGSINNMNIGALVPGTAKFTTLYVINDIDFIETNQVITIAPAGAGTLIVNPTTTGSIDNINIGENIPGTGNFSSLTLTQEAEEITQVPTKGYVDAKITAFSIAFGA